MIKVLKEMQSFVEPTKSCKVGEVLELSPTIEKELIHLGFAIEYIEDLEDSDKEEPQPRKRKTKEDKEIYQTKDE